MKKNIENLKDSSRQFGERWGKTVVRFRWPVLIGTLLFAMAFGAGGQMGFNSDYHVFFSEDNPQMLAYDGLQNKYTKDDNVFIVLAPKDGQVFTKETLTAIEELTAEAWQTPYSSRVDAITNFQYTRAVEDDLYVEDLIEDAASKSEKELAEFKNIATEDPRLVHRLINEAGTVTAVNVTVRLPEVDNGESAEVTAFAREMVSKLEEKYPNIDTYLSGMVMLNSAFFESANGDFQTLTPLMFLIVIITILLTTRTFSGTFSTLIVIVLSIMTAMGFGAYMGIGLTPPSGAFINIILTLAVADSIHVLITIIQQMRKGVPKREAIVESLRLNFMPVFITSLTTVIGFLSMNFSDSPPFHDLGNLTAVGMVAAFLYSTLTLPALLAILPVKVKKRVTEGGKLPFLERLAEFVIANKRPVIAVSSLLIITSSFLVFKNELNDEFIKYFSKDVQFRSDTDYISDNLTGIYTVEFSIAADEEGGINDPSYLNTLKSFEDWLYTNEEVIHVNAFTEVMEQVNKSMHGDDLSYYKMPDNREEAAQYLLLYEMSLPFGLDLNNQVNVDKSETRVIVTIKNIPTQSMLALSDRATDWLDENAPSHMRAEGVSSTMMFAHLSERQIMSMISGTAVALLLISIVLAFAIRSGKFGFLSLIPNITPVIIGLGIWGLFYGYINTGISIVFGMTLGIIVDDTVHFLSKYLRARRELGKSPEDSVRYAFSTVGQALLVTTFVLVAGFLVLAQSNFGLNSDMAKITTIIIIMALVLDFLMLPALLMLSPVKRSQDVKNIASKGSTGDLSAIPAT
ncbi:RND family transporter [Roseivirga sp. E12]|uniref:efflux RND transporter permease subunit n=1 Tax=Roseivirga sp. E12 TaxID=2819237 RepID=UPI001ABCDF13|nr:MMPL family transporter [Roseivirga sp. E12]MBO3699514.1 MMPL family transporter [Roseivirga sp. E12]